MKKQKIASVPNIDKPDVSATNTTNGRALVRREDIVVITAVVYVNPEINQSLNPIPLKMMMMIK